MAVAVLSPAPTTPAAKTAARECLREFVAVADGRADALIAVGAALTEREAPNAPQAIKNEAVIRLSSWLQARPRAIRSQRLGEHLDTTYVTNHGPMFRLCGAKALLSPWKRRRAL